MTCNVVAAAMHSASSTLSYTRLPTLMITASDCCLMEESSGAMSMDEGGFSSRFYLVCRRPTACNAEELPLRCRQSLTNAWSGLSRYMEIITIQPVANGVCVCVCVCVCV